ncbi:MAG: hypothetical protein KKE02_16570 [Alphaproteobacteria bacterium]|nr:hypothetical protein [Alphaproteobacteria bacterium]MBU1516655.1 hypothetical protein [Alphaproteobacteria bacterium]MBU2094411.1 hypothetical protein [Alphaproteobacteria bacterium]MBU2152638.1 hypothetical protein [Alphaproteobacteria bacterium]MBU2307583.1 hypothetical protein [Alphaproteobacteria bacterium]
MTDPTPRSPDRKLGLVAPVIVALVCAAIVIAALAFGGGRKPEAPLAPTANAPPAAPTPVVAAPVPPAARADLLDAARLAADAYARGDNAAPAAKSPLAGRTFALRLPFGCEGPQLGYGVAQAFYELDPEARTVRLIANPGAWTALPLFQEAPDAKTIEAAEGFWIPRPWSHAEGCPPERSLAVPAAPTPAASPTLGLAQLFLAEDSRVARRSARGYEKTLKLAQDAPLRPTRGYRLVLEGRFGTFPNGRTARCWSESADHRPVCVYAVTFDRVAFEAGDDGRLLAEWRD